MSRTRKGSKSTGYEVDRKREGKRGWRSPGALAKRIGHKAQRKIGKTEAREALERLRDAVTAIPWPVVGPRVAELNFALRRAERVLSGRRGGAP